VNCTKAVRRKGYPIVNELHQSCVLILSGNFYFLQNLCRHNKLDLQWRNQVSANYRMYDSVRVPQINWYTQIGSANQLVYPNCSGAGTANCTQNLRFEHTGTVRLLFLDTWINFAQLCMQHENCWYTWQKSNSMGNMEKLTMAVIWKKLLVKLYTEAPFGTHEWRNVGIRKTHEYSSRKRRI